MRSAATIVTFNPDPAVRGRIRNVSEQVEVVYLVDNSASPADLGELPANVEYLHNRNVGGLAGALNTALRRARADELQYLFVFDQDTDVPDDLCSSLLDATGHMPASVAVLGPMHLNASTGYPVRLSVPRGLLMSHWPTANEPAVECMFLINSCSLLNLGLIGPDEWYDESLPVDMTDVDFCLRLRGKGLIALCVPRVQVTHGIGHRKPGAAMLSATNYSADRKYMQMRARIIVWRRYASAFPHFVLTDAVIAVMDFVRTMLLEGDRPGKLRAYSKGLADGIKSRAPTG